jgi:hypothetical protein
MKTPEIRALLDKYQKEMKAKGLAFFCVAEMPGTKEGASIFDGKNNPDGAATNARKSHEEWESKHGIDTKHDWSKDKPHMNKW